MFVYINICMYVCVCVCVCEGGRVKICVKAACICVYVCVCAKEETTDLFWIKPPEGDKETHLES